MAQLKIPTFKSTARELTFSDFSGGINYKDNASLLAVNQSPEAANVRIRDGTIGKRSGYSRLFSTSLGGGPVNGIFEYTKADSTVYKLIAHNTSLYTQDEDDQPVLIRSGLENAKASFFVLSDICYLINGSDFLSFDGENVDDVQNYSYIPTVLTGRSPSGSPNAGIPNESFNLLNAGFGISFSGTGTDTTYILPYTDFDATAITVIVDGAEVTGFTFNRIAGVVTFTAPPLLGTDNVTMIVFKSSLAYPEYILNCTKAEVYGGKTSATVFMSGNPNYPDLVWHSRLYGSNFNADYWPDDGFQKVTGNVAGLAHIFDLLYVSHSKGHGYFSYADGPTYPIFPYADINLEKGSDIPGSIQEVNNTVVCASTDNGVLQVLSDTTVNNRLSVNDVSNLIDKAGIERQDLGLLRQPNLKSAVSYNYDGYYGLCVNNVCYVWDYKTGAWLYDTNIPASCFAIIDGSLCFGSNAEGLVYRFDELFANDDGSPINAFYDTREENAGTPTRIKVINRFDVVAKPLTRASINISLKSRQSNGVVLLQLQTNAFGFVNYNFVNFTFNTSFFPIVKRKRIAKRANYFQFQFANNVLDEGMSLISFKIAYDQGSEMR